MPFAPSIVELLHFRGRCNRAGFAAFAVAVVGVQIAIGLVLMALGLRPDGPVGILLNLPFFWFAFTALVRRLHDMGYSGWWVVGAIVLALVWSIVIGIGSAFVLDPRHLLPPHAEFFALVAAVLLPQLAMLIWVHVAPSEPHANRHGPVPTGIAFTLPSGIGNDAPIAQPA